MQYKSLLLAGLSAATVVAQDAGAVITPDEPAPAGCEATVDGTFEITLYNVTQGQAPSKRDLEKRQSDACGPAGTLVLTLKDGVLLDSLDRTGYIASNRQFQFDGPAQSNAVYTAGWSVCQNSSLALGPSANFYRCLSGSFYNLYDVAEEEQCELIAIGAVPCGGGSLPQPSAPSPVAPSAPAAEEATQIVDGQIQAPSASAPPAPSTPAAGVSQIADGQIQAPSGQAEPTPIEPVSQISDGQIQVPTEAPAAPPAPPAASGPPVQQIPDGQIQATGSAAVPAPPQNSTAPTAPSAAPPAAEPIETGAAVVQGAAVGLVGAVAAVWALVL